MKLDMKSRLIATTGSVIFGILLLSGIFAITFSAMLKELNNTIDDIDSARYAQVSFQRQVQDWKNVLIRNGSKKDYDKYLSRFEQNQSKLQNLMTDLINQYKDDPRHFQIASDLEVLKTNHQILYTEYKKALKLLDRNDPTSYKKIDNAVKGKDRAVSDGFDKIVDDAIEVAAEIQDAEIIKDIIILICFIAIVTVILVWISWINIQYMSSYNSTMQEHSELISHGDFTQRVDKSLGGDFEVLGAAFNGLYETVGNIISKAQNTLLNVTSSVEETDMNVKSIENMIQEQQVAIHQISQALNDLVNNIENINISAQDTQNESSNMRTSASQVKEVMASLYSISQEMSDRLLVIDDISNQINLLSLNASIESARAGEAGRGFAVVAEEIRKLATKTNAATSEIRSNMNSLTERTGLAQTSVEEITEAIKSVSGKSSEVSAAVEHQSSAVAQVSATVEEFSGNLQGTSENIKQTAQAMQSVAKDTQELDAQMAVFKTKS
jgi:methyl-accepting chemotaxis protein